MTSFAICGFGNIGRVHLANLRQIRGCRVAGVFDVRSAVLHELPPDVTRYASLAEMLSDREIRAVVIATGADSHREIAEQALSAGKDIFVEKPLAATLADAQGIADAAKQSGLCAQAGFCERFNPQYLEGKEAVLSGVLGAVRAVQTSRIAPYGLSNTEWPLGVLDTAVHNLDLTLWMLGELPQSVHAYGVQVYHDSPILHSVTSLLRFSSGAVATDHVAWIQDGAHPLHQCARSQMRLIGSKGTLEIDLSQRPSTITSDQSYRAIDTVILGGRGYPGCLQLQFEAFLRSLEDGAPVLAPLEDAVAVERVVMALAESLRTGQEVAL